MHAWFKNTKVTNVNYTLYPNYESIIPKLVDLNTNNIKDMSSLFYGCSNISGSTLFGTPDDFSSMQTDGLEYIDSMFEGSNIGSTNANSYTFNLKTNNVKYMSRVFADVGFDASTFTSYSIGNNFNTSNVVDMSGIFSGCSANANTNLSLSSNFNTGKVTNFSHMFEHFNGIDKIIEKFYNMNTSSATDMSYMFN